MGHDVFISHSSKDKVVADAVCAALEQDGLRCWVAPRDILPGASWPTSILKAIADSRLMVLIFSRHTQNSNHVRREVERAVHHGLLIAPVRIEDITPADEFEYFLSSSHWLDAMKPPFEQHLKRLAENIRALLVIGPGLVLSNRIAPAGQVGTPADHGRRARAAERPPGPAARCRGRPILAVAAAAVGLTIGAGVWTAVARRPGLPPPPAHSAAGPGVPRTVRLPPDPPPAPPPGRTWTNSIGMRFVDIRPGTFVMGSPPEEAGRLDDEAPVRVTLTRPFSIGACEVTQAQWRAVTGTVPGEFGGDDLPVERVSWEQAVDFAERLGRTDGRRYRLPTEAEWEYACRAGTTTPFHTGPQLRPADANYLPPSSTGALPPGYRDRTMPVGSFKPNAWGLHDTHGNVWEWCADWYGHYPAGPATDPGGPAAAGDADPPGRVLRGGAFNYEADWCRSARRYREAPAWRYHNVGVRLCADPD